MMNITKSSDPIFSLISKSGMINILTLLSEQNFHKSNTPQSLVQQIRIRKPLNQTDVGKNIWGHPLLNHENLHLHGKIELTHFTEPINQRNVDDNIELANYGQHLVLVHKNNDFSKSTLLTELV